MSETLVSAIAVVSYFMIGFLFTIAAFVWDKRQHGRVNDPGAAVLIVAWPLVVVMLIVFGTPYLLVTGLIWVIDRLPIEPGSRDMSEPAKKTSDIPLCPRCHFPRHPNCECNAAS